MKPGDPASRIELLSTVARAGGRFASVGYLDAKISVDPQKDDAHHEIAYKFSVTPGEQYRFASVKTVNLTADQEAEFDKNWKLVPGQVYNQDAVRTALQKSTSSKAFQGGDLKFDRLGDPRTHLVTVMISFVKTGSRPS